MNDEDELRFGVVDQVWYGTKAPPVPGAQWTGIITSIALKMLESGAVDAVVCVQSDPDDRSVPVPTQQPVAGRHASCNAAVRQALHGAAPTHTSITCMHSVKALAICTRCAPQVYALEIS